MSIDTTTAKPAPALKKLGRYEIVAELGRGAMGTVYHGVDATIERPVALKTLNPELPPEILAEVKERFMREAKSAGRLNHPNIVTIYEFGEDAGTAFIAMEFLEGKSLQDVMRGGRLPFAAIADIVAQMADALDYANRFGVVHRDIKPANIMIAPHGVAKLTDFGIARVQSSSMTQTGAMLGSPKYMSPEQVLGQQADGRADIFSLGVVLYEMLAAATPFETRDITVFSLMQRIVTVPHPPVMEAAPDTPQPFEDMLKRALAKKPEDRYQRASEFANDLRNLRMALSSVPSLVPGVLSAAISDSGASGAAPASSTEHQRTVVTNPGAAADPASNRRPVTSPSSPAISKLTDAGIDPAFAVTMASMPPVAPALLGDLDSLGASIDAMQEKFLAEENQAMRKIRAGASNSKDWSAMAGAIETLPSEQFASPGDTTGSPTTGSTTASSSDVKRSSVFGLLRQQSGPNLKEQAAAKQAAEAAALLAFDAKLRRAYTFLLEFFREANEANPQYAGTHSLPYFGACPPLFLSEGVVNARMRRIEDNGKLKDITDHLIVSYRLTSTEQRRITANMQESLKLRTLLDEYEMKYTAAETRNDFNQVTRSVFDIDAAFMCAVTLRADYANQRAELMCRNIGPLGRRRYLVPAAMMNDHLWEELSKLILGYPSAMVDGFIVAK